MLTSISKLLVEHCRHFKAARCSGSINTAFHKSLNNYEVKWPSLTVLDSKMTDLIIDLILHLLLSALKMQTLSLRIGDFEVKSLLLSLACNHRPQPS